MSRRVPELFERIATYDIDGRVHPIQARKAWEDTETWNPGIVVSRDGNAVDVLPLVDGEVATEFLFGRPAWITERWGVLAYADAEGNAVAIDDAGDTPGTVFGLAGADRLAFISVKRSEAPAKHSGELVYATITGLDGIERFVINRRVDAEYQAEFIRVSDSCSTWGEVRKIAGPQMWTDLLERTGYGDIETFTQDLSVGESVPGALEYAKERFADFARTDLPDDDEPFDVMEIAGCQDGDYPPAVELLHASLLPRAIAAMYASEMGTIFNGTSLYILPEDGPAVVRAMRAIGYVCVEDPDLFHAGLYL